MKASFLECDPLALVILQLRMEFQTVCVESTPAIHLKTISPLDFPSLCPPTEVLVVIHFSQGLVQIRPTQQLQKYIIIELVDHLIAIPVNKD